MPGSGYFNVPQNAARTDFGGPATRRSTTRRQTGDDYEPLRDEHLDLWNVDYALLTGARVYGASVLPDPDFAAALCRAFND